MADAKREVIKLFQKIEAVKNAGLRSRYGVNRSEMFRLYGMIEWILGLEETDILEQPEGWGSVDPYQVKMGLKTAKERLNVSPVTEGLVKKVNMACGELSYFPKYLELPGPVVREKIVRYLNPDDQLSVASAIPSEVEYFKEPLNLLQFEAVFPILYANGLLEEEDVENLKEADPYFRSFIKKHLEDVTWNRTNPLGWLDDDDDGDSVRGVHLKDFVKLQNLGAAEPVPVCIFVTRANYIDVLEQLRTFGEIILECSLTIFCNALQLVEWLVSCLQLMPNLRKFRLILEGNSSRGVRVPESTLVDMLPNLGSLRTLCIFDREESIGVVKRSLFRKYGPKIETVALFPGRDAPEPSTMVQSENLTTLMLIVAGEATFEGMLGFLNMFRECRLKNLKILCVGESFYTYLNRNLRQLLTEVGNRWGQTLQVLSIRLLLDFHMRNGTQYPPSHEDSPESAWMTSLEFPKLRSFELNGYPIGNSWAFLLLFPALQKFVYYPLTEDPSSRDKDDPMGDEIEKNDDRLVIEMHREKDKMMRSHMWKIFPRLDWIQFRTAQPLGHEGEPFMTLTRKECMAFSG